MSKLHIIDGGAANATMSSTEHSNVQLEDRLIGFIARDYFPTKVLSIPLKDVWAFVRASESEASYRRGQVIDALSNIAVTSLIQFDRESSVLYPNWPLIESSILSD